MTGIKAKDDICQFLFCYSRTVGGGQRSEKTLLAGIEKHKDFFIR
jgi:hypothetical protein